jgi:hypothetical protein
MCPKQVDIRNTLMTCCHDEANATAHKPGAHGNGAADVALLQRYLSFDYDTMTTPLMMDPLALNETDGAVMMLDGVQDPGSNMQCVAGFGVEFVWGRGGGSVLGGRFDDGRQEVNQTRT